MEAVPKVSALPELNMWLKLEGPVPNPEADPADKPADDKRSIEAFRGEDLVWEKYLGFVIVDPPRQLQ